MVSACHKKVRISTLEIDDSNTLWVGTFQQGVFQIDLDTKRVMQYMNVSTPSGIHGIGLVWDIETGTDGEVWVGSKVTFLDGSEVGNNSVVAAGAVVNGKFPPNVVIGGVPAKVIKEI